jgi:hypothetical protein
MTASVLATVKKKLKLKLRYHHHHHRDMLPLDQYHQDLVQ